MNITEEEALFIRENRLTMSMNDMALHLNCSYSKVRKYIVENNLGVPKAVYKSFIHAKVKVARTGKPAIPIDFKEDEETKERECGLYYDKLTFAKKQGFKNIADAIAAWGLKGFNEKFNLYSKKVNH